MQVYGNVILCQTLTGMGSQLPSQVPWRIQTPTRHVLDTTRGGWKAGRWNEHHGQTVEQANRPTSLHRAQFWGYIRV